MIVYHVDDFIDKLVQWCYTPSIYGLGAWGWPMTNANKARLMTNSGGKYNSRADRRAILYAQDWHHFAADCVNMIKALLWGFDFDETAPNGGATYATNGVPDTNETGMIKLCYDVSDDFSKIIPGEFVWFPGHCGIYVGMRNGETLEPANKYDAKAMHMVIECTPAGADGVQFSVMDNLKNPNLSPNLLRRGNWQKHGKLPWIDYTRKTTKTADHIKHGIVWESAIDGQVVPYLYKNGEIIVEPGEHFVDGWHYVNADGTAAVDCDVWISYVYQDETPGSTDGKWVRYDVNGDMVYGPDIKDGSLYFFDEVTGAMYKGKNAVHFLADFDLVSGKMISVKALSSEEDDAID